MSKPRSFKEALTSVLTEKELSQLKRAYDLVGDIAIIEIDEELRHKEQEIGETLLNLFPSIKVVVRKDGAHEGLLRLQEYKHLAGEERLDTIVVESGVRMHIDISKTYYSVRSGSERLRIASLVKPGEEVLVMFSGIAPFPLVIAKHSEAKKIVGVELNEDAAKLAEENVVKNKFTHIETYAGDVRTTVPTLGMFDRICMPLPHTADDFLDVAVPTVKEKGMIHLYHFATEEEVQAFGKEIPPRIQELGRTATVEHIQQCGSLGPGVSRWCLDILVN